LTDTADLNESETSVDHDAETVPCPRLTVVTLCDGERYHWMADQTMPLIREFCGKRGYRFVEHRKTLDPSRATHWSKFRAIKDVLPDCDWAVWIDVDLVLWNGEEAFENFLPKTRDAKVVIQENRDGINNGIFAVKNDPWSYAYLDRVDGMFVFESHPFKEQQAMAVLLGTEESVRRNFVVLPAEAKLQGYYAFNDWADKMFVHFAGVPEPVRSSQLAAFCRVARLSLAADAREFIHSLPKVPPRPGKPTCLGSA
jgi:hypothetical protein